MSQHRLFFALWPTERLRQGILDLVDLKGQGGRAVIAEKLHVTVVFLGSLSDQQMQCVSEAANKISENQFVLGFDQYRYRKRSGMLWLTSTARPSALICLEHDLRKNLQICNLSLEQRSFKPHLTLARKMTRRPILPDIELPLWRVTSFSLVESEPVDGGTQYNVVQEWPLRPS